MIRAVLDTNIIVSAIISPQGTPAKILRAWRERKFQTILSKGILEEVAEVLIRPRIVRYHVTSERRKAILKVLYKYGIMTPGRLNVQASQDPGDNRFLAAAIEGEADYVVSGDPHLLRIRCYEEVEIVTANFFLMLLERQPAP